MSVIVLNKMFSGKYLSNNLGHEVINLFKSDDGKCYLYLNENGMFDRKYANQIDDMLLVKNGPTPNTLEVIGKSIGLKDFYQPPRKTVNKAAEELEELLRQHKYVLDNKIMYGGTYLHLLFAGNEYQYVNITFEAKTVKLPSVDKRIIISFDEDYIPQSTSEVVVKLTQKDVMRRSLKEYFDEIEQSEDYNSLKNLINTQSIWGKEIEKVNPEKLMIDTFYQRISQNRHLNKLYKGKTNK